MSGDTWSEVIRLAAQDFSRDYGNLEGPGQLADFLLYFRSALGAKDVAVRNGQSFSALDMKNCVFGRAMTEWGRDLALTCDGTCHAITASAAEHAGFSSDRIFADPDPPSGNCSFEFLA